MSDMQTEQETQVHVPVLQHEVIQLFSPGPGDTLLDCTVGHGGHAQAYLQAAGAGARCVGLDADPAALVAAERTLHEYGDRVTLLNANFAHMKHSVTGGGVLPPEGFSHVLFDLGIGSHQLDDSTRGFSFRDGQSLSMRYGSSEGEADMPPAQLASLNQLERQLGRLPEATDIIERLPEHDLAQLIRTYGEERHSKRIAAALQEDPIPTSAATLAERIATAVPVRGGQRIHPATLTFQALRLAVNRELEALQAALPQAVSLLKSDGVLVVISFHSLEDRIVKHFFRQRSKGCICPPRQPVCTCATTADLAVITKKPVRPSTREVEENRRARSAKLRAARRVNS